MKTKRPVLKPSTVPQLCPGGTVACLASGPSLTQEDADYVRGRVDRVIVVNTTYKMAPWADCLCAADARWWAWHKGAPSFKGLKFSSSRHAFWPGVQFIQSTGAKGLETNPTGLRTGINSGYRAINIAVHFGAKRIILLGYDMQQGPKVGVRNKRQEHWHGEHPNRSRSPYEHFIRYFNTIVEPLNALGVEVINCTPDSALKCFPQRPLREVLQ